MTDDSPKAGEYELVALLWDEPVLEAGKIVGFTRHRRGERVTLGTADARRLVACGAVVVPGTRELAAVEQARAFLQVALAQVPVELREQLADLEPAAPQPSVAPGLSETLSDTAEDPEPVPVGKPAQNDAKAVWVAYAVSQGVVVEDAEGMTKQELIELYGG